MYDKSFLAKVIPALRTAFDPLASVWNGRFYYMVPPEEVVYPCGVYQSQDLGGRARDSINSNGWQGLITFRSIARSLSQSEDKLLQLAVLLPNITHEDFDISIRVNQPITLPIEEDSTGKIYTSGLIVDIGVYPK